MKILVTGGAGYIGSLLVRELLKKNHEVRVMDIFNFGSDSLKEVMSNKNLELVQGDIRKSEDVNRCLENMEAVIHLAAIVGDPACAIQADIAVETNYLSTLRLAMATKEKKINKFLFSSTCSVYGAGNKILTEESELNPQSLYAETKLYSERGIMDLSNDHFKPIILRLGTLYGLSSRPRFDLIINYLTSKIIKENSAMIFGGEQWRPFVHVSDSVESFCFALENYDTMKGEIFNVGSNRGNYQMRDIGLLFEELFEDADIQYVNEIKDPRSYRVSFDKMEKLGCKFTREIKPSILEIEKYVKNNNIDPKQLQYCNIPPLR